MRQLFISIVLVSMPYAGQAFAQTNQTGQQLQNIFNPRITVFGNATLRVDDRPVTLEEDPDIRIDDRFNLRETEIDFRAAVDPFADAILIAAFESEVPGEFEPGIEEGYVTIKALPWFDRMPLGLRFKIGRFRADFGQINLLHTHDLPQTTRPLVIQEILGDEGLIVEGVTTSLSAPLVEWASLSFSGALVNSGGLPIAPEARNSVAYLGRAGVFLQPADSHSVDLGASTYAGDAGEGHHSRLAALDLLYKWKPVRGGEWRSFLLGAEAFQTFGITLGSLDPTADLFGRSFVAALGVPYEMDRRGYYSFLQYQGSRNLYLGIRWDWFQPLVGRYKPISVHSTSGVIQTTDDFSISAGETEFEPYKLHFDPDVVRMVTPYASYYFSEFLRLRASWERTFVYERNEDTIWLELNFVFGSHPPEPYWVNR